MNTIEQISPDAIEDEDHVMSDTNMIIDHETGNNIVNNDNNSVNHNNDSDIFCNEDDDYLVTCSMCCGKFKNENDLQNHVIVAHRTNDASRPYQCGSCAMSFQRKSSLKNHSKIHTYGRPPSPGYKIIDIDELSSFNKNDKQKSENHKLFGIKKGFISVKKFGDLSQDNRIPPFETIKPNTVTADTNYSLDNNVNNLFDNWNISDVRDSDVNISAGDNNGIDSGINVNIAPDDVPEGHVVEVPDMPIIDSTEFDSKSHITKLEDSKQSLNISVNHQIPLNLPNLDSPKEKPYTCPFCNRTFAREKALLNHIRIHNDNYDMTLECQKCHDVFDDIISLQAHLVACVLPESGVVDHHPPPAESPEYIPYDHKRHNFNTSNVIANGEISVGDHVCEICHKRFKTRQKVFR